MDMPDLIEIKNGSRVKPTFSDAEMERRLSALRREMARRRIDAALFTSYHCINYYADFLYCYFGRSYGLVVTQDKIVSISANIDGGQPWRRTYGQRNRVYTDWKRGNFFRAVAAEIPAGARVGVERDWMDLQTMDALKAALPGSRFADIAAPAMRLRMVKSAEEIAHIAKMTAIADIGGAAVAEAVRPGVAEHEVALHATGAMVREIARVWPDAELLDTWTWFQSGINTDGAHNPVTSRRVKRGDILSLNCFPMVAGYYVALERTLFCAEVDDASRRMWDVNCRVHDEGKKLLRPGMRCMDVALALNEIYAAEGLLHRRTFGYGHSFGVLCHYYGREAGLELREDVETVLEPGMVVSMEPMIMIPEGEPGAGGYREHDILVITADGAVNLTNFPYGPDRCVVG
jgi:creatinase